MDFLSENIYRRADGYILGCHLTVIILRSAILKMQQIHRSSESNETQHLLFAQPVISCVAYIVL